MIAALVVLVLERHHLLHRPASFDPDHYPVRGIDVSNHNGEVQWDLVAEQGYRFVYLKASEGATHIDARFRQNAQKAAAAGLKVGAYHFFRKNRDGEAQASNMLAATHGVALDLPLVVDGEDWENDHWQDEAEVRARLRTMVSNLIRQGRRVMISTNGDGYSKFYQPNFPQLDLWLCSFNSPDSLRLTHGHTLQQYSHWGEVEGIEGDVDLDLFVGSEKEWKQWLDKR